jgi:hypothetical protein
MANYYKSGINDFGEKDILVQTQEDIKKYEKYPGITQPMPGSNKDKIIEWAKSLVLEAYDYKKPWHDAWSQANQAYYTSVSNKDRQNNSTNPGVDQSQDSSILVPAVIKRFSDLVAFWLCKEIYKAEPFVQFTSYSTNDAVKKAQRLLERKYQGDAEKYGAREKASDGFIDLALLGNAVFKAKFHQERLLVEELDGGSVEEKDETDLMFAEYNEPDENVISTDEFDMDLGEPTLKFSIIDQYAEFAPIYLGNFFIDPFAPGKDWRKASYMADVEYVSTEELFERFGEVKGFKSQFESNKMNSNANEMISYAAVPFGLGSDDFTKSFTANVMQSASAINPGRAINSVLNLYTKYTETVIVNDNILVYHKVRDSKIRKAGAFPYVLIKLPTTSNSLFSTGLGHLLRGIQEECTLLASQRLKMLDRLMTVFVEVVEGSVEPEDIMTIQDMTFIKVQQAGGIQFKTPPGNMEQMYLGPEARNMDRAREYAGLPGMIDSSDTKSHLGAVSQRMEASQVQLQVLLDRTRDEFKRLHMMMHIFSMAYLSGDQPLEGSTMIAEKDSTANVLTEEDLALLRLQPELAVQLNAGVNIGADKFKSLSALLNTSVAQGVFSTMLPEKQAGIFGQMMDLLDVDEFKHWFSPENMKPPAPPAIPGMMPPGAGAEALVQQTQPGVQPPPAMQPQG